MSASSPLCWRSRGRRKHLLVACGIGVIVLAVSAAARADETSPPAAAVPADTTALARRAIVAGHLPEALRILNRLELSGAPEEERSAAFEMRAVVDRWVALGATIAPRTSAEPAPLPGTGGDEAAPPPDAWESAFAVSRARLVAGNFQDAGPGFALLIGSARNRHQWLRASSLAALANELVAKDVVLRVIVRTEQSVGAEMDRPPAKPQTHWYGWQTLMADGVSIIALPIAAMGSRGSGGGLALAAVGGYLLGGPIVHLAHGEVTRAGGSLGIRLGLPLAGALGGAIIGSIAEGDCRGDFCGYAAAAIALLGGGIGIVTAVVVDSAVLAYEKVEEPKSARSTPSARAARPAVAFRPLAGPRKEGGFDVGVGGTF